MAKGGRFGDCGGGGESKAVVQVVAWSAVGVSGGGGEAAGQARLGVNTTLT